MDGAEADMPCYFCYHEVKDPASHAGCGQEYQSRRDSGLCTRCGKVNVEKSEVWCDACDDKPSVGYPGV